MDTSRLPEHLRFVILCCKAEPTAEEIAAIRLHVENTPHLEEVSMLAYEHGVYPLFYLTLMKHASDLIDDEMKDAMAYIMQNIKNVNQAMTEELIGLTDMLEKNDIEVLSFKGPVLASFVYGDIAARQYGDLDLLLHEQDVYKSAKLLVERGYRPMLDIDVLKSKAKLHVEKNFEFYRKTDSLKVEIHWRLIDIFFLKKFDSYDPWQNTKTIELKNKSILTLNNEFLLIYLCSHGASHMWERLSWILDIDRCVRNMEIDWKKIEQISSSIKAEKSLLLGLYLSQKLFDTPLPKRYAEKVTKVVEIIKPLADKSIKILGFGYEKGTDSHDDSINFGYQFALQDDLFMKGRFLFKRTLAYSKREVGMVDLPEKLFFVYYFLRFGYLMEKVFAPIKSLIPKRR